MTPQKPTITAWVWRSLGLYLPSTPSPYRNAESEFYLGMANASWHQGHPLDVKHFLSKAREALT